MDGRSGVNRDRAAEVSRLIEAIERWARSRPDLVGVAVVGSWARNSATMASDVDLVLLSTEPAAYLESTDWWAFLGPTDLVAAKRWGALGERRLALPSGLEIELGIAEPSWASVDPPDPGTERVVRDGMVVVFDRDGLFQRLIDTVIAD